MKKILFMLMTVAILTTPAMALSLRQHQVSFVDEFGEPVTTITSITVFNSGLGSSPTIFSDRAGNLTMVNPITTSSTNSTFLQAQGQVRWFQQKPTYKLTVTDGTKTLTIDGRDEGDTRFAWYDNYIGTAASLSVNDNQSITVGTDSDMVLAWNNGSGFMSWIPAADGSAFNLGTSGTAKNVDFNWFVGTALGIKGDEGAATLVIDGLTTSINASSNFATNINTGTSTGAVTIGNSAGGAISLDTDTSITVNADDSYTLTVSAGTIGIAATGGDITIDATDKSVIIRGSEAVADAVTIVADTALGGIDITSQADIDITTTGAAGEDITLTNTGGSINLSATEDIATAIVINSTTGGIDITADGAAGSDLDLVCTSGSTNISGGEAIADAVTIAAGAGGVDITSAATFDIDITATGGRVLVVATEAVADQFKVDAQGTVAGFAIVLETTNGGIQINADDASNGDITIDAADVLTFITPDPIIVNGNATSSIVLEGTANGFETTLSFTDPTANGTLSFPDSADEGAAGADMAWVADAGTTTKDATDAALPVTDAVVQGTSDATSSWSLPNGEEGQILSVVIVTDGGAATITPDTCAGCGWATAILTDDIDQISFLYVDDTVGWIILGTSSDGTNIVEVTQ